MSMSCAFVFRLSYLLFLATLKSNESFGQRARLARSRFNYLENLANEGKTIGQRNWQEAERVNAMALCMKYGLDRRQRTLCIRFPLQTLAVFRGYKKAVNECEYQFRNERWNCSSLVGVRTKNIQPLLTPMMKRGFKEVAFVHALVAAAVAMSVSLDCARGAISPCGKLGSRRRRSKENDVFIQHGLYFSEKFLSSSASSYDLQTAMDRHNLKVGRLTFTNSLRTLCRCHGVSGSCTAMSCVKTPPDLRHVGTVLKQMYNRAKKMEPVNERRTGVRLQVLNGETPTNRDLIYMEKSPTFCDRDDSLGITGIKGRPCIRNSTHENSCGVLCCGHGYNILRWKLADSQCECEFQWCCVVKCKKCRSEEWATVCK